MKRFLFSADHSLGTKSRQTQILYFLFVSLLLIMLVASAAAAGSEHAYGYRTQAASRGNKIWLWTPTVPNGLSWTSGLVTICESSTCSSPQGYVETGWIAGTDWELNNHVQQVVSFRASGGVALNERVGSYLSEESWNEFKVLHSNSEQRWEAWRGSSIPWYNSNLGFSYGAKLAMGVEAKDSGGWMGSHGYHPQYKTTNNNNWTLYNYVTTGTTSGGCISHNWDYGFVGWSC